MMKKLLLIVLPVLFFAVTGQAQVKVWNFACDNLEGYDNLLDTNEKVEAALYSGTGGTIGSSGNFDSSNQIGSFGNAATDKVFYVNDPSGDRLRMNTAGFTAYNNETKSIFDPFFGAGVPWGRLYSNGTGSSDRRYYGFNLTAGDVITIYYYIDNSDLNTVTVETPSSTDTFEVDNTTSKDGHMAQITASEDGLYKFYTGTGKICVGRIYEGDIKLQDGNLLSVKDIESAVSANVKAIGNRIFVSNVKSNTEINLYSITGAMVKSLKTGVDTDFSVKPGLYIATLKTAEGQKSVKLLAR